MFHQEWKVLIDRIDEGVQLVIISLFRLIILFMLEATKH